MNTAMKRTFLLITVVVSVLISADVWAKSPAILKTSVTGAEYESALALGKTLNPGFQETTADDLSETSVLWIHLGDSEKYAVSDADAAKIKAFVEQGGGLFLTGASWRILNQFGLETVTPRQLAGNHDRNPGAAIPFIIKNGAQSPVFNGLKRGNEQGQNRAAIYFSDGGYSAFSDFHAIQPRGGTLLAASAFGDEKPIWEYSLGKGRIITSGWRLTCYSDKNNAFYDNLTKFTSNVLNYLQTPSAWIELTPYNPNAALNEKQLAAMERDFEYESESLKLAINDLIESFPQEYVNGQIYLDQLAELEKDSATVAPDVLFDRLDALKRKALLENPLLKNVKSILAIRRTAGNLGLPSNWASNSSLRHTGYDNDIISIPLSLQVPKQDDVKTVYRPQSNEYVGELDLHFNSDRLMFSKPYLLKDGGNDRWQLFEIPLTDDALSGQGTVEARKIQTIDHSDVDNYDACYLPNGRIIFTSTAPMIGVPCVRGSSHVTNTYVRYQDGRVRQLTFDQEHNWNPTVMHNGRIMYLRWEYTDTPHAFYRLMFTMNPDGTNQVSYYGSNSYWPNSMFNAKPTPGNANRFYAVVVGHHDVNRAGELVLFDTSISDFEADGAVQKIGQRGKKVEPILKDGLTGASWPKFLHPSPLSDKYVIVSCKPSPLSKWGVYLVDVFDNFVLLYEQPGYAILEPVPLQKTPIPPAIVDRTNPESKTATVFLADIYTGPGLKGIRRGEVKQLRVFTYNYSYHGMGGQYDRVGLDGPWDVRSVLGTVPVEEDGSAHFTVPANTPIALQPLDENGAALQLMRSWFTAMPGEVVSCVGCHQNNNLAPVRQRTIAGNRPASKIAPFYGPDRGFSFRREVQPILDKYCVGCHAENRDAANPALASVPETFSLENTDDIPLVAGNAMYNNGGRFSKSYMNLRRFVRGHTIESDAHLLSPREFHVSTTRLFQTLRNDPAGHYGVTDMLSPQDWDVLTTWVDMNTPFHGTWIEISGHQRTDRQAQLREELREMYSDLVQDQEGIFNPYVPGAVKPVLPPKDKIDAGLKARAASQPTPTIALNEPFDSQKIKTVTLPNGETIEFVYVPKGTLNGQPTGGFWISKTEITNAQFHAFDPKHDSRYEFGDFLVFSLLDRGFQTDGPDQPVVRVSCQEAEQFCQWLSQQLGKDGTDCSLPTDVQWTYAARAGSTNPKYYYGKIDDDFSSFANLSDVTNYVMPTFAPWSLPSDAVEPWRPADERFNDSVRATANVASYKPNAWGLYDVHGNAAEWLNCDGDAALAAGGSFNSRPSESAFDSRIPYPKNQPVFDVGFRVILKDKEQ